MANRLTRLEVHNFRSLANVNVQLDALNVLFGPNGAGKSTFLDAIEFVRDCAGFGVDEASSQRSHGIGMRTDGVDDQANISVKLETELAEYKLEFGYSSGRIEPYAGEMLFAKTPELRQCLIDRKVGSDEADFYLTDMVQKINVPLREPEKLALSPWLYMEHWKPNAASQLDKLLRSAYLYHSREANFYDLKRHGSESSPQIRLWDRCQNLWSVLRNLHDRRGVDERYDTIVGFMRQSFPLFKDLLIEQTGSNSVYGNFIESGRRNPIAASGVADGYLQMLILLTALFSEGKEFSQIISFDEPETSLHPHALAVFAQAVKAATMEWDRQVFIATHSPVLISQFVPESILVAELNEAGQTVLRRANEIEGIQDLLEQYALGSLYMAGVVAPQSQQEQTHE